MLFLSFNFSTSILWAACYNTKQQLSIPFILKNEFYLVRQCLQSHPPGAINVQVYRLIKEWTAWDIARRAAFAFFGIFSGTEENPEFLQSIESGLKTEVSASCHCHY